MRLDDAGRGVGGAHDCWGPRVGENILCHCMSTFWSVDLEESHLTQADRPEQTEAQGVYEQEPK